MRSKIIRLHQRRSAGSVPVPSPKARQALLPIERTELRPTYEELKQDLIKHPNRMVFIKDFGPALFQEEVKTPKYQQLVFQNYFKPKLKTTITPYNFGKILTNVSEASPELQFSLAYSEILVGGLTESVASKHEGWSHAPSNGELN